MSFRTFIPAALVLFCSLTSFAKPVPNEAALITAKYQRLIKVADAMNTQCALMQEGPECYVAAGGYLETKGMDILSAYGKRVPTTIRVLIYQWHSQYLKLLSEAQSITATVVAPAPTRQCRDDRSNYTGVSAYAAMSICKVNGGSNSFSDCSMSSPRTWVCACHFGCR